MSKSESLVIRNVRAALAGAPPMASHPPVIAEATLRLVFSDIGLPALFEKKAKETKLDVVGLRVEALHAQVIAYLKTHDVKTIGVPDSKLFEKTELLPALRAASFELRPNDVTADAAVTDVYRVVAETGSLALRAAGGLAVRPRVHVAVVEPKNCVADLVDLFTVAAKEQVADLTLVSGGDATALRRVFLLK